MNRVASPSHGHPILRHLTRCLVAGVLVFFVSSCADTGPESPTGPSEQLEQLGPPAHGLFQDFGPAIQAADRYTPALMQNPNIVGTAVGLNDEGRPSVRLFLVSEHVPGLPEHLDDVPVSTVVTGQFHLRQADPTKRARPAPMGFSVGHPDITAGTLGARVTDGTNVFILSNNHVLANSNDASIGDDQLQPGSFDGGNAPEDVIGTLADFEEISFSDSNIMDAAIALVDPSDVSGATPEDAYGAPGTNVQEAQIGMGVQKYGRTTGHTTGTVEEINVTVSICFATRGLFQCAQSATFVDQISIGPGSFSDGGDSGSLIVTGDNSRNPVGLLFAGSTTRTLANPIGPVLDRFGVEIDTTIPDEDTGEPGDPDPTGPTAEFSYACDELQCQFNASGSTAGDEPITSYNWDLGDDTSASGDILSHSYANAGTYSVTLTVTDEGGLSDSQVQQVTVQLDEEPVEGELGIDHFQVSTRSSGPWQRATVQWTVSHTGSGLGTVTTELLGGGTVLDAQTTNVSGDTASGESELRTRTGNPDTVRLTVTDVDGNTQVAEAPVF